MPCTRICGFSREYLTGACVKYTLAIKAFWVTKAMYQHWA